MKPVDDLSRSLVTLDQESALVAVIELSNASWLVAGTLPGVGAPAPADAMAVGRSAG
jgi:transposase